MVQAAPEGKKKEKGHRSWTNQWQAPAAASRSRTFVNGLGGKGWDDQGSAEWRWCLWCPCTARVDGPQPQPPKSESLSPVCRAPNAEITADPVEKRTTEESKEIESGIVPGPLVQSDCTKS